MVSWVMTVIRIEMWNRDDAWNIGTKVTLTSDGVRAERAGPGGQGFFGRPGSRNIRRGSQTRLKSIAIAQRVGMPATL